MQTPWGSAESLRGRRLSPGPGTTREEVERNQRERLYGALLASVARRGYAATRVSDLVQISGVSSKSFYALFADKERCLLATVEALTELAAAAGDPVARAVEQPAAAQLCLTDGYAGGSEVRERLAELSAMIEARATAAARVDPRCREMPEELVGAAVGAAQELARRVLAEGGARRLPERVEELVELLRDSYSPPPEPLRRNIRRAPDRAEQPATNDPSERILHALTVVVAERGWDRTTIAQIVKQAGISTSRFYELFESKEAALLAAIDSAGAQMGAVIEPALRRNPLWPHGVRSAMGTLFNLLASRPALANLMLVEVYAAGAAAVERRDEALSQLDGLWREPRHRWPQTSPVLRQAILDGILHLARKVVLESGPPALPSLAPVCAYVVLAPFVGADAACAAANGEGQAPVPTASPTGDAGGEAMDPLRSEILTLLHRRPTAVAELASQLEQPESLVHRHLQALARASRVYVERKGEDPSEDVYRSLLGEVHTEQMEQLSLSEQRAFSERIAEQLERDLGRSLEAGTFFERPEQVLVATSIVVDERGWHDLAELHVQTLAAAQAIQAESQRRLASGGTSLDVRHVQGLFEMP